MMRAAIFDMDGLVVDSEPLWVLAEQESFAAVGLDLTTEQCRETTGLGIDEVVRIRHTQLPWNNKPLHVVSAEIIKRMEFLLRTVAQPMAGARDALAAARARGLRVGLASSSHPEIITAALDGLSLHGAFDHVLSAMDVSHRKPHPAVFLEAANRLGIPPGECVVFEDSIPGIIAAKAASMCCVAVPEPHNIDDPRYTIADITLPSLEALDWAVLPC